MPTKFGTLEHWRERAEEARIQAEQMSDKAARKAVLAVAESYEKIAKRAERVPPANGNSPPPAA
jgi:hypothetical protein